MTTEPRVNLDDVARRLDVWRMKAPLLLPRIDGERVRPAKPIACAASALHAPGRPHALAQDLRVAHERRLGEGRAVRVEG